VEEGFFLYWGYGPSRDSAVDKSTKLPSHILSRPTPPGLSFGNYAPSLTDATSHPAIFQNLVKSCFFQTISLPLGRTPKILEYLRKQGFGLFPLSGGLQKSKIWKSQLVSILLRKYHTDRRSPLPDTLYSPPPSISLPFPFFPLWTSSGNHS